MDRFDSMTAFVKVVECGTFSGAARRLDLAPAIITRRIQDLESRLGIRLFNRSTRRVSLTEVGRAFYERCTRILADLEETEQAASEQQATVRGVLHVNASLSFGMLHLAPAIARFTACYPEVSVELTLTDRVVDLIEEGFDLAVRAEPLPDSGLVARRLVPCRSVVCAAPGYLAERGVPRTPAELTAHNCLTLSTSPDSADWIFIGANGTAQRIRVAGNLRANSSGALVAAAIEGQGLILEQTCTVGEELKAGRLVAVLTDYMLPEAAIRAVFPHRLLLSGKVRTFVDFLAARFGHDPDWDDWRRGMSPQRAAEAPCDCVTGD